MEFHPPSPPPTSKIYLLFLEVMVLIRYVVREGPTRASDAATGTVDLNIAGHYFGAVAVTRDARPYFVQDFVRMGCRASSRLQRSIYEFETDIWFCFPIIFYLSKITSVLPQ